MYHKGSLHRFICAGIFIFYSDFLNELYNRIFSGKRKKCVNQLKKENPSTYLALKNNLLENRKTGEYPYPLYRLMALELHTRRTAGALI